MPDDGNACINGKVIGNEKINQAIYYYAFCIAYVFAYG